MEHPAASRATAAPPAASSSQTTRRARATTTNAPPTCAVAAPAYIHPWPMASSAPTPMATPARPPVAGRSVRSDHVRLGRNGLLERPGPVHRGCLRQRNVHASTSAAGGDVPVDRLPSGHAPRHRAVRHQRTRSTDPSRSARQGDRLEGGGGIGRGVGEQEQGAVASAKRGTPYDQLRLPRQFTRRAQLDHAPAVAADLLAQQREILADMDILRGGFQ